MGATNKKIVKDVNGQPVPQYFDVVNDCFVAVSSSTPFPIKVLPKHSGFLSSQSADGWITTTVDDEEIVFDTALNTLIIEADATTLKIKINDNTNHWFIDAGGTDGIEDFSIEKIAIIGSAGQTLRWKGLYI